jgi:hypothetical protein
MILINVDMAILKCQLQTTLHFLRVTRKGKMLWLAKRDKLVTIVAAVIPNLSNRHSTTMLTSTTVENEAEENIWKIDFQVLQRIGKVLDLIDRYSFGSLSFDEIQDYLIFQCTDDTSAAFISDIHRLLDVLETFVSSGITADVTSPSNR